VPAPLSKLELTFPENLGIATSGLGLASCEPALLQTFGGEACPPDSQMGSGSATVAVRFGPEVVPEQVTLGMYAAPSPDGYIHLAILASGKEPILAHIVMSAVLLPGRLQITVPPVPSLPEAANVSVVAFKATLGGALTYYERVRGRAVAYRPRGIALPERCPHGGWRLSAQLGFTDGAHSRAQTVVGCPARRH